jgi:uncharacterized membrane protein
MSAVGDIVAGPLGAPLAILAMTAATYLCRVTGFVLMSRIAITPRVDRALRALPGSIVVATVLPLALDGGVPALTALAAAVLAMGLLGIELVALLAGLAAVGVLRAAGF